MGCGGMIANEKLNELYKNKIRSVIEGIKIALVGCISCDEDDMPIISGSQNTCTVFTFIYDDGSKLMIDTTGKCQCSENDSEYWIY